MRLRREDLRVVVLGARAAGIQGDSDPRVLAPHSRPHGRTYGEWSAAWYQWALSIPAPTNPILDTTGQYAGVGQHGHVWFLAGTFGTTVTRTATVPTGTMLFFPVLNVWWDNQTCVNPDTNYTIAQLRALNREAINGRANLAAEIDGVSVQNLDSRYRVESPVFSFRLPANDVVGCGDGPETVSPVVADGWHLMLAPLSQGRHTIHFHAEVASGPFAGFKVDVTYNLTVTG